MPLTYEIDERRKLVKLTAFDTWSREEWFETFTQAIEDPRFRPGFDFLYDRTRVNDVPDIASIRDWVPRQAELLRKAGNGWLAAVVASPTVYSIYRVAGAWVDELGAVVEAFWTEKEALRWLDSKASTGDRDAMVIAE
jgi:hypothetical protein